MVLKTSKPAYPLASFAISVPILAWTGVSRCVTMRARQMARELRRHQLSVRIPVRVYQALEAQAEQERRTVADVVNNLLDEKFPIVAAKEKARRG